MQTPAHVAISLFLWRSSENWKQTLAIVSGAILPDLNMFFFYGFQKLIGSSESDIWGKLYFQPEWQLFFDLFNSIPIYAVVAMIAYWIDRRLLFLLATSSLIHCLCDLPLHNDDAHRHFLPLSNWRFISPVSYWDPQHFGIVAAIVELVVAVAAAVYLSVGQFSHSIRWSSCIVLAVYVSVAILVLVWLINR